MYHYVREDSGELPYFKHLNVEDFKQQLDYFEREFGFIKKDDFLNALKGGEIPQGVILTFDDGLKDHHKYVLPELVKRGLWGIFYINKSSHSRKKLLTPHRAHLLLGKFGGKKIFSFLKEIISENMLIEEYKRKFEKETYKGFEDEELSMETKRILNYYISEEHRGPILDRVMDKFYPDEKQLVKSHYLNSKEIKDLADKGMLLGAHTVNHPVMSKLSKSEQKQEIGPCFEFIDETTGRKQKPRTYCHPYGGARSFNEDTVGVLEELGCLFSLDVNPMDVTEDDILKNRQALPRYDCNLFPFGQSKTIKQI